MGKGKLSFTPGAVGGILPASVPDAMPVAPERVAEAPAEPRAVTPPQIAEEAPSAGPGATPAAPKQPRTRRARTAGAEGDGGRYAQPTFNIDAEVMERVQAAHKERNGGGRPTVSYLRMLLEAISEHRDELARSWVPVEPSAEDLLFARLGEAPPEKRPPTAKLTLAGLRPEERQTLDELVAKWQAPNLTAVIEKAFALHYPATAARRRRRG